ncbi:putative ABC transport system permease protein [Pseudoduganella lurida]|uniref:Putative ABC transport system permease protein n=1 Tax=Pseudoduganella lurida TaxID=1036180 RepID=A0A562QUN6_9BURK|nr:ABC transporter permease [Pseudoduganella lurida]TWI60502.1 putative ABC transport system permease protein [Pseudoduganella lurida]
MFTYYLKLGARNLRRNPALTALMVLTLAIGVAASVATLTILHVMSGDPLPHKSSRLVVPAFDVGTLDRWTPGTPADDDQHTYRDAMNLLAGGQGERRTALMGVAGPLQPERRDLPPFDVDGGGATRDVFAMFEIPFRFGQAWSAADDKAGADVIVLTRKLSEKLYGDANPVGRRVRFSGFDFVITGVMEHWDPVPRFYRVLGMGAFDREDEFFLPLASAVRHELRNNGSTWCNKPFGAGYQAFLDSECTWLQVWFELPSAADRPALQDWLNGYTAEQRRLGRLPRKAPVYLYDLPEWLVHLKVVGNDNRLSAWLALGFLALCLVNTIGLLLAKFSVRASEVGVRRALGATRGDIFRQFLTESAVIGLAGGVLGLLLAFGALALISLQSKELALVAHMDWLMLAATFAMAVGAAVLAGLLPTWRACQVTPALQLKSQ